MIDGFKLPSSPSFYPDGGTYADLLYWHLFIWGTRSDGTRKIWRPDEFRAAVFVHNADSPTAVRSLNYWLGGGSPPNDTSADLIMSALFDGKSVFEEWMIHLRIARKGSKGTNSDGTHKNINSIEFLWNKDSNANSKASAANTSAQMSPSNAGVRDDEDLIADPLRSIFVGRAADIDLIDDFVRRRMEGGDRGLLVITAPAGFGKSALAVHWLDRARKHTNRRIVSHICSMSNGADAAKPENIYADLYCQISEALGPSIDKTSVSALRGLLLQSPSDGMELVIWLDGIDEASGDIDCFLPSTLAPRICVIVSARALENTLPAYLVPWIEDERAKRHRPHVHALGKLSSEDVEELTARIFAGRAQVPDRLATRIFNASEQGYSLFTRNMAETALEAVLAGENIDLGNAPESLLGYAKSEVKRLQRLPGWSADLLPLFALLIIAREAVSVADLPDFIGKRIDPESLPHQFRRWLNVVEHADTPTLLSFAHPLLADVFGQVRKSSLPRDHAILCDSIFAQPTKRWSEYMWRHVLRHQLAAGRIDEAASRLAYLQFISDRFDALGATITPLLMAGDWMAWYVTAGRGQRAGKSVEALRHVRFWNNYATRIANAASKGFSHTWQQLMQDVGLIPKQSDVGLNIPEPDTLPDSLATLSGHEDSVWGALVLDGGAGFLSWSPDNTLRLWSAVGEQRAVLRGHEGGISGALVLEAGAGFLSWGRDNTLRLWSAVGEQRAVLRGHDSGIDGALALEGGAGFLSWSWDNTLRLWSAVGEQRAVLRGHDSGIAGALALEGGAGFLSWGWDNTLRLWSAVGEQRAVLRGHDSGIAGALALEGGAGFLSWGWDNTLRLWSAVGEQRAVLRGHEGNIAGALALEGDAGFVSWGRDNTLRLWSAAGERRAVLRGHKDSVDGALALEGGAGFLSWSSDNTLRLWSKEGEQRGELRGHEKAVAGALVLEGGTQLLSWSADGTLRLWDAEGEERAVLRGHTGQISHVVALKDGTSFLSFGRDHSLRLWNTTDKERAALRGCEDAVEGALAPNDVPGFTSWSYDRKLRVWDAAGDKRAVLPQHESWRNGGFKLGGDAGFVTWGDGRILRLVSLEGKLRAILHGHTDIINGVRPMKDGMGFLSWGEDGTLLAWDNTGNIIHMWISPAGAVYHIEPHGSPGDYLVAFGNHVGIVHLP